MLLREAFWSHQKEEASAEAKRRRRLVAASGRYLPRQQNPSEANQKPPASMRTHGYDDLIVNKRMRSYTMRLFFCFTDVGCFEFLFTTDDQRATELIGIYIVLAKLNPSKLWFTELSPETVIPSHREHLQEALSWGLEGFASYEEGKGWVIRPVQDEFDHLSTDAGEGAAA